MSKRVHELAFDIVICFGSEGYFASEHELACQ